LSISDIYKKKLTVYISLIFLYRPGKLCILCNLSEHSQLGQGEMLRIECSIEELPKDLPRDLLMSPPETLPHDSTSPRPPLQSRRQKGPAKCRYDTKYILNYNISIGLYDKMVEE
jgi:hypothetical protein